MSDEKVEIDVVADASAATRSTKAVADELSRVVSKVGELETKLHGMLTGKVGKDMEKLAGYVQMINATQLNGKGLIANDLKRVGTASRALASGGPTTQLDRAAFAGTLATLKTDKAFQALQYEKDANKVLAARAEIYDRLRKTQPDTLSESYRTKYYRDALQGLGEEPDPAKMKAWQARTLAEVRKFEQDRFSVAEEFRRKELMAQQAQFEKLAARSFSKVYGRSDQDAAGAQLRERLAARGQRFGLDTSRLGSIYDQGLQQYGDTTVAKAPKPAKVVAPPPSREQKAQQGIQAVQDRFSANGGAGMFAVQAQVLRNYATMGAVLGTLSYVGKSTVEFQTSMKDVQAISRATNTEMTALQKTIFDVGSKSKLSAKEIAEGVKVLAQAGYSVQQIGQMIEPINNLAVGSGSSLTDAANIVTSVLSAFDLSVGRTAEVTNIMVAGLNQSKLSMEQLGLGIQYAGNIAAQGGVQFEELVAALGAASDAGIKSGSTLGTGFRSVIEALQNPTKKLRTELEKLHLSEDDVDVKTHGLTEVLKTLKAAGFDSSAAFGSMETRAAAFYTALSGNLDKLEQYNASIVGTNAAQVAANTQMESFTAQWQRLLNAVTQVSTVMGGPILGTLTALAGGMASALSAATPLAPALQAISIALVAIASTSLIRFLLGLVGGLIGVNAATTSWTISLLANAAAQGLLGKAMMGLIARVGALTVALLANPWTWVAAAIAAVIVVVGAAASQHARLTAQLEKLKGAANDAGAKVSEYQQRVQEIDKYVEMLSNRHQALSTNVAAAGLEASRAQTKFGEWGLQLDANGRTIDGLIVKMINLRGQMAAIAHEQARVEGVALAQQQVVLGKTVATQATSVKDKAAYLLKGNNGLSADERAALQKVAGGDITLNALNTARGAVQNAQTRLGPEAGRRFNGFLSVLNPLAQNQAQVLETAGQRRTNAATIATTAIAASPQGAQAATSINGMLTSWRSAQYQVNQIKDPAAKAKAQAELDARKQVEFQGLQTHLGEQSKALLNNPEIHRGLQSQADLEGTTLQAQIEKQFDFSSLSALANRPDGMDEGALRSRAKRLQEEALTAKKGKRLDDYKSKRDEAGDMLKRANYLRYLATGEDASTVEGRVADEDAAFDEQTKRGMMGSSRGSGNRSAKRVADAEAKALERMIEVTSGNLGPGADEILAGQGKLKDLVNKWEAAKRSSIRAGGGSADDIAEQLEDFEVTAKEFRDKVLNGNIQAAKDLLAKYAQEAAGKTTASMTNAVRGGQVPLQDALANVNDTFNDLLTKTMDAADQEFRTKGLDPAKSAEAAEKRKQILRDVVTQALDATNAVLAAENARVQRKLQVEAISDSHQRSRIAILGNFYGQRSVGDTHRYVAGLGNQKLDERDAQRGVTGAKADYDQAVGEQSAAAWANMRLQTEASAKALGDAQLKTQQMADALDAAEQTYFQLTEQAQTYSSFQEAATGAWQRWIDESGVNRPVFEQLADGLTGVFDTTRSSFQTLVSDVLTGNQTMAGAFKGFTLSILDALADMAAKMIANKIIMWAISLIPGMGGEATIGMGSTSADWANFSTFGRSQAGGDVPGIRRYKIGGGPPAANRDSVHTLLEPGEVVMRKSAVDFIGRDNLLQMNAMGNRRVSQMPTLQDNQRQPDEVNVWVVKEEAKPQMGKRDVIAIVTEDLMTGGQTRRLVKQIQVGAT